MMSNKWKEAHHARKRHCFRIVCRNGDSCERLSRVRRHRLLTLMSQLEAIDNLTVYLKRHFGEQRRR
jgi:hypothetical protein